MKAKRIARVAVNGRDLVAIEHKGDLYRVDVLDEILGSPLPTDARALAYNFDRRVFALGLAGLDEHVSSLGRGAHVPEARLDRHAYRSLPPVGMTPAVLETQVASASDLAVRISGRAIYGSGAVGLVRDDTRLLVTPALVAVLGEDLHLPTPEEASRAIVGYTLGLAWSLADEADEATRLGLGPSPARDAGTHLGPILVTAPPLPEGVHVEGQFCLLRSDGTKVERALRIALAADRVGRIFARAARFGDARAGDIVCFSDGPAVDASPGDVARIESEAAFGNLEGRLGGPASVRA